jgi:hypothetical protein
MVDTTATAGDIWVDDGSIIKPGNGPFDGILDLFGLGTLGDLFNLDVSDVWANIISLFLNPLGLLEDTIGRGDLLDTITGIFGSLTWGGTPTNPLADLLAAFTEIPSLNVTGTGGPADIGSTIQQTWNQWIGGLVGSVGTGAGLVGPVQHWAGHLLPSRTRRILLGHPRNPLQQVHQHRLPPHLGK